MCLKNSKETSIVGKGWERQEDEVRGVSWAVAAGNLLDHTEPCKTVEALRKSAVTRIGLA